MITKADLQYKKNKVNNKMFGFSSQKYWGKKNILISSKENVDFFF